MRAQQLDALTPLLTEQVRNLANTRLLDSSKFFSGAKLTVKDDSRVVKLALLLVEIMNPYEDFSIEEEALMRGISSKTLRLRKEQDRLVRKNRMS